MGILDDAKETVKAAGEKLGETIEDGVDRLKDKGDEIKADAEVKKAEAEADSVRARNEAKEKLRD
jgi:vacuolar-type H+-ATPase subunit H